MRKNIDKIIRKALHESLHEKTEDLTKKIKSKVDEWTPNAPVTISAQDSDIHEEEMDERQVCDECGKGYMEEGVCNECGYGGMHEDTDEFEYDTMEEDMDEGNAFSGALSKAKEAGKSEFNVDGKKYHVRESKTKVDEKWKDDVDVKKTGEYADMTIDEINSAIKKLKAKNEKYKTEGKNVPEANKTKMSQLYFAKRAKQDWKGKGKAKVKESFQLTESEMIDLIEKIVLEQKKAKGMSETEKVLSADKKENDQYIKDVTKKMKDYLKNGSKGEYTMEPKGFPKGNGALEKDEKIKKYTPSDAVDEYIDAFAYPGMTNLVYDEIKPDEERIEKYIKGHKTTGNAEVDEDGKAYGNVVPSKVGEKFMKNYKDNLYGAEQMDDSYKRQPQDVLDVSGEKTQKGGLQKLRNKNANKAKEVLNNVDENKKSENPVLNEEFNKMKHLISYNKKTQ